MCVSLVTHKPFLTKITFTCRKTLLFCSCCYSLNLFARWREEKCHFILNWISFFGGPPSLDVVPQQYLLVSCVLIYSFDCIFVLCLQFLTCATHKSNFPFLGCWCFWTNFRLLFFLALLEKMLQWWSLPGNLRCPLLSKIKPSIRLANATLNRARSNRRHIHRYAPPSQIFIFLKSSQLCLVVVVL